MEISERRVIGALLLLLSVSLFTIGLYAGQLNTVAELLKRIFSALGL